MEEINGVSFEDWGAACGNIAAGMSAEEVCKILGIELPVWQKTNEAWGGKLGDLMAQDMNLATTYSGYFTNPKVGKFANAAADVPSIDDLLAKVPDYDAFQKIMAHQTAASDHGLDAAATIEGYGFNLQQWGQLSMHYSKWFQGYVDINSPEYEERFRETSAIMEKWENHWKEHYKNDAVNLSEDIDF